MSVECQLGMCSYTSYIVSTRLCILRKSGLSCCLRDKAWFLFSPQKPHFNCKRGSGNICHLNMLLYMAYESEDKLICCNLVMQQFSRNTLVLSFVFNWFTHEEVGVSTTAQRFVEPCNKFVFILLFIFYIHKNVSAYNCLIITPGKKIYYCNTCIHSSFF